MISIKRIYEDSSSEDGYRMLVDRLWPRGMSKEKANLDEWNKSVAPSTDLRKWFAHRPERFEEFAQHYESELENHQDELNKLRDIAKKQNLTLLYAAKNPEINHAVVLKKVLENNIA